MKTYTTVDSNRKYGFTGFVFSERLDSNRLYDENFGECFYISKIEERDGVYLCYCSQALSTHGGGKYVTNPDWPVAKYRLGEKILVDGQEDVINGCMRISNKDYQYSIESGGATGKTAWYSEDDLKPLL